MEYDRLAGLCTEDYVYPGEDNAFAALKKIPVLDQIAAAYLKYISQIGYLPEIQGNCYCVTKETCPEVYAVYQKALQRLDFQEEYPLYVKSSFEYNAFTSGGSAPYIVIHSSILKNMSEEELLFILGHELGHVKSGHLIYYIIATQLNSIIANVPMAGSAVLSTGIHYALVKWQRMQELTADRAGAIAAGGTDSGISCLGKLLGTSEKIPFMKFSVDDLKKQNDRFEEGNEDIVSKIYSAIQIMNSTHPWTVSRIKELDEWKSTGGYEEIILRYGRTGDGM